MLAGAGMLGRTGARLTGGFSWGRRGLAPRFTQTRSTPRLGTCLRTVRGWKRLLDAAISPSMVKNDLVPRQAQGNHRGTLKTAGVSLPQGGNGGC